MEIEALEALCPALEQFAQDFDHCVKTRPSRRHFRRYLAGQMSSLKRKCVEPIALMTGVAPRTLQEFLAEYRWDHEAMVECQQRRVAARHAHENAIGLIDETSFPKKGEKTPGVQRQHCGATGKVDNCVVSVHLGYVAGDFHAILDNDLFLPEGWIQDPARCKEAGIPLDEPFRTKPQIAVDQLEAAVARGVEMRWLCADELYGRSIEFRHGVADLGITYAVEIPSNLTGWLASRGTQGKPRRVDRLWERGGPSWEAWHVKDMERGPAVWDVRAVRFHPLEEKVAGDGQWLLIACNRLKPHEIKYFLCNAGPDAEVGEMLEVAFYRWHIERLFRESKQEAGLDHYEGRLLLGWQRHLLLTSLSILFLCEQRERMRTDGSPFSLEQLKQAMEVQLDPEMPRVERRRQLQKVVDRILYHQRRNAAARRSHTKTRRKQLEQAGIDFATISRCPRVMEI